MRLPRLSLRWDPSESLWKYCIRHPSFLLLLALLLLLLLQLSLPFEDSDCLLFFMAASSFSVILLTLFLPGSTTPSKEPSFELPFLLLQEGGRPEGSLLLLLTVWLNVSCLSCFKTFEFRLSGCSSSNVITAGTFDSCFLDSAIEGRSSS